MLGLVRSAAVPADKLALNQHALAIADGYSRHGTNGDQFTLTFFRLFCAK